MLRVLVVLAGIPASAANGFTDAASAVGSSVGGAVTDAGWAITNEANYVAGEAGAALSEGEHQTVAAGLQASGQCPSIWKVVPDIIKLFETRFVNMANDIQKSDKAPTTHPEVCQNAVAKQVNDVIEKNLQEGQGRGTGQLLVWERQAADAAAWNAVPSVCSDTLMSTMKENEAIRKDDPHKYVTTIVLKLHSALPKILHDEIGSFCPAPEKLFSLPEQIFAAPAAGFRVTAVITGAAGFLLLFVAGVIGGRRFVLARRDPVLYTNVVDKEAIACLTSSQP